MGIARNYNMRGIQSLDRQQLYGHAANAVHSHARLCTVLATCFLLCSSASGKKARASGPVNSTTWERGLVKEDISWREVVRNHDRYFESTEEVRLKGNVLAFVTPWNSKGYDTAKTFRSKLTHVAPVWYILRRSEESFYLTGQHDIDREWMAALRHEGTHGGRSPKIVPRVNFELKPMDLIGAALDTPQALVSLLLAECLEQRFDGWVIEAWSQWSLYGLKTDKAMREKVHNLIKRLAEAFHAEGLELHLAVPPVHPAIPIGASFSPADWEALSGHVDGLSVMTYDHASNVGSPGPNAPFNWVGANAAAFKLSGDDEKSHTDKVMLGLNFYGMDFTISGQPASSPVLGREVVQKMRRYRPRIMWDAESEEHVFEYVTNGRSHKVYYPTLLSVSKRLQLAQQYGLGVCIWEIGQGLDFFYDLL